MSDVHAPAFQFVAEGSVVSYGDVAVPGRVDVGRTEWFADTTIAVTGSVTVPGGSNLPYVGILAR